MREGGTLGEHDEHTLVGRLRGFHRGSWVRFAGLGRGRGGAGTFCGALWRGGAPRTPRRQGRQGGMRSWLRFFPAWIGRAKPGIVGRFRAACGMGTTGRVRRRREKRAKRAVVGSIFPGSGGGDIWGLCVALCGARWFVLRDWRGMTEPDRFGQFRTGAGARSRRGGLAGGKIGSWCGSCPLVPSETPTTGGRRSSVKMSCDLSSGRVLSGGGGGGAARRS